MNGNLNSGNKTKLKFRKGTQLNEEFASKITDRENELLMVMLEDEVIWLSSMFKDAVITTDNFFHVLKSGVMLCRLANVIREHINKKNDTLNSPEIKFKSEEMCNKDSTKFLSRDNVHKFLHWCRGHGVPQDILFESNDCVEEGREGRREIIICLMNIARFFYKICDIPVPEMVRLEREIDNYIENEILFTSKDEEAIIVVNNDKGKDIQKEVMVNSNAHLGTSSPVSQKSNSPVSGNETDQKAQRMMEDYDIIDKSVWIGEGRFKIGAKVVFVRMINDHLLVRVGGGWQTLSDFLEKNFSKSTNKDGKEAVSCSIIEKPHRKLSANDDKIEKNRTVLDAVTNSVNKRKSCTDKVLRSVEKCNAVNISGCQEESSIPQSSSPQTEKFLGNVNKLPSQTNRSLKKATTVSAPQITNPLKKITHQETCSSQSINQNDGEKLSRQLSYICQKEDEVDTSSQKLIKNPIRSSTQVDLKYKKNQPANLRVNSSKIPEIVQCSSTLQKKLTRYDEVQSQNLKPSPSSRFSRVSSERKLCQSPSSQIREKYRPLKKLSTIEQAEGLSGASCQHVEKDFIALNKEKARLRNIRK